MTAEIFGRYTLIAPKWWKLQISISHKCFHGQSRYDALKFVETVSGQGHVTPNIFGR